MLELVEAAHRSGRLRDREADSLTFSTLVAEQDESAHRELLQGRQTRECTAPPFIERLRVVASSLPDTVTTTSRFIARAERAMSAIEKDLDGATFR